MPFSHNALAPHPPSPSPRKFGLRLISMASRLRPNLRGEGGPDRTEPPPLTPSLNLDLDAIVVAGLETKPC